MDRLFSRRHLGKVATAGVVAATLNPPTLVRAAVVGATTWYFAEGYTAPGFDQYLTIQNPNPTSAAVTITYYPTGFPPVTRTGLVVDPNRRYTVPVHDANHPYGLGRGFAVSTKVTTTHPDGIIVERPMYFLYGGTINGGHNVLGAHIPRTTWYFAEGYTAPGFDEYLCLFNPNDSNATIRITYGLRSGGPVIKDRTVPARARSTITVHDTPDGVGRNQEVSIKVTSLNGVGIVAERVMYFSYRGWTNGHAVLGAISPGSVWYFAEGATADGYEEYLSVFNPNAIPVSLRVTYYYADGRTPVVKNVPAIAAQARTTIAVHNASDPYGLGPGHQISTKVETTHPGGIIAERVLYFPFAGGGGHSVMGAIVPAYNWYFAEGWTGPGFNEYLVLFNPNPVRASFTLYWDTRLSPTGAWVTTAAAESVVARGRKLIDVNARVGSDREVAVRIVATGRIPIVAERTMYFNYNNGYIGSHGTHGWFY